MASSKIFITGIHLSNLGVSIVDIMGYLGFTVIKLDTNDLTSEDIKDEEKNEMMLTLENLTKDKKHVAIVVPNYGNLLETFDELFPDSKLIVYMHNPLDLGLNSTSKFENYAKFFNKELLSRADIIVRIEELALNTKNTILNVIKTLNIEIEPEIINKASNTKWYSIFHRSMQQLFDLCKSFSNSDNYASLFQLLTDMGYVKNINNEKIPIDYSNCFVNIRNLEATMKMDEEIPLDEILCREFNDMWRIYPSQSSIAISPKKLKIAICISGQPRFIEGWHYNIFKVNVLDKYDCDTFCHFWWNGEDNENIYETSAWSGLGTMKVTGDVKDAIESMYTPKSMSFDPIMKDDIDPKKYPNTSNVRTPYNLTSMYTSMKKSYELMRDYSEKYGVKYDYVIRYRYDGVFDFFPNLYQLNQNNIYFSNLLDRDGLVSNNGCIIPMEYAEDVFTIVDRLDILYKRGAYFNDEQMCWSNLWYTGLLPRLVKLPTNIYHPDCYRGPEGNADRRKEIKVK
jgi:hypothetical protein